MSTAAWILIVYAAVVGILWGVMWALDKNLLTGGNGHYSPGTCAFLPKDMAMMFTNSYGRKLPRGIIWVDKIEKYRVRLGTTEGKLFIGEYRDLKEAEKAYDEARVKHLKRLAGKYRKKLDPRVYDMIKML